MSALDNAMLLIIAGTVVVGVVGFIIVTFRSGK